jgi:putative MATE family efflux protein
MRDLTKDSIVHHILTLAAPIAVSMLAQLAYQLVDLYFVTRLGVAATAGVNAAGNATLLIIALAQVLNIGTAALVAHAVGRKRRDEANLVFNQSVVLAAGSAVLTMALLFLFAGPYMRSVAADAATVQDGIAFTCWVIPGIALMIPLTALGSALRGTGIVRPHIIVYTLSVILNACLAPVLIAGVGTGMALGVRGAGLATSISVAVAIVALTTYYVRAERYLEFRWALLRPRLDQWRRIVGVGLPAGGELILTFLSTAIAYYAIRNFGASAQAGFGIGSRVLQVILLPAIAIGFAAGPIAGQNFGARNPERVRQTFRYAALLGCITMAAITIGVQWGAKNLVDVFDADTRAAAAAVMFLQLISWTFVAQGLVYVCSSMFQGLGSTLPSLVSAGTRFLAFTSSVLWLSAQRGFSLEQVWYLLILSVGLQAAISLCLLRLELRRRLPLPAR